MLNAGSRLSNIIDTLEEAKHTRIFLFETNNILVTEDIRDPISYILVELLEINEFYVCFNIFSFYLQNKKNQDNETIDNCESLL